jgi:alpha-tubulin suppressor-like RCC1 family protein
MALAGCGAAPGGSASEDAGESENIGSAVFELAVVPTGVGCVRVTVTGSSTVTKDFTVTAGGSSLALNMDRLPLGTVAISGAAYQTTCGTGATLYVADPAAANIETGVVTNLALTFRKNNPVTADVNFVGNIQALSIGSYASALVVDGQAYVWGTINTTEYLVPTLVNGLTNVVDVALGDSTACALKKDGTISCWGDNSRLQAGVATPATLAAPAVALGGDSGYTAIAGGGTHFCAIKSATRTMRCWGANNNGQFGDYNPVNASLGGAQAQSMRAISAGDAFTCGVLGDSAVVNCTGWNSSGELGTGVTSSAVSWQWVSGSLAFKSVSAGVRQTCGILLDGTARCWGANYDGGLGNGTTTSSLVPVTVSGLYGVKTLTTGMLHACALLESGVVKCWGYGGFGSNGDNSSADRYTPVSVQGLPGSVEMIGSGSKGYHQCAVTDAHDLYCWGKNDYGQLGDGTHNSAFTPVRIKLP